MNRSNVLLFLLALACTLAGNPAAAPGLAVVVQRALDEYAHE